MILKVMEILDGRYVGNGEKNLFLKELGNGKIPIVIEPGWGGLSIEWQHIQKELAKHTKVITYDRAGYGESPVSKNPRTSLQIANELYIMLKNSGIEGPYLFVAHDAGGLYIQHFLKMFASNVAGLVLVDSLTIFDNELDSLDLPKYNELASFEIKLQNFKNYSELSQNELEKYIMPLLLKMYENFPDVFKKAYLTYLTDINYYKTVYNEMSSRNESIDMLNQLSLFTNIPVAILIRDYTTMIENAKMIGIPEEEQKVIEELWLKYSHDLENLSTDSELSIVKGAGHNIHIDKPEAIIKKTLEILEKCD